MHCASTVSDVPDCKFKKLRFTGSDIETLIAGYTAVVRRQLRGGETLFDAGDAAPNYFYLLRGNVMVDLSVGAKYNRPCLLGPGQLFVFACGETHVARCVTMADSEVLVINRWQCDRTAQDCQVLLSSLQALHAAELLLLLGVLNGENCRARCVASQITGSKRVFDAREVRNQGRLVFKGEHQREANANAALIS